MTEPFAAAARALLAQIHRRTVRNLVFVVLAGFTGITICILVPNNPLVRSFRLPLAIAGVACVLGVVGWGARLIYLGKALRQIDAQARPSPERLPANGHPREQAARARLTEAGAEASPDHLYSLQLALFALDEGVMLRPGLRGDLQQALGVALGWSVDAQVALVADVPPDQIEAADSPREAGAILLAEVTAQLADLIPGFRPCP